MDVPEGAKRPTDHLASAEREVKPDTVEIRYGEFVFTVPGEVDNLPGEFLEAAEDGKSVQMVSAVLGVRQTLKFRESKPKVRDWKALGDQVAEIYGFLDGGN